MISYTYNGTTYTVPDSMTAEDALGLILAAEEQKGGQAANSTSPTASNQQAPQQTTDDTVPPANPNAPIDPDTLSSSKDWIAASNIMYRMRNGQAAPQLSDKDAAEYGLDHMGWFNYNLPYMAVDALRLKNAKPEEKQAFLYLMDTYDKLGMSWGGVRRFIKGAAADPTNYVGLATLGISSGAKAGTQIATKEGIKALLRGAAITGVEGAMFGAAQNTVQQTAELNAGRGEQFDNTRLAGAAALGAGAGAVLGAGASALTMKLGGKAVSEATGRVEAARTATEAAPTGSATTIADDATKAVSEAPTAVSESSASASRSPVFGAAEPVSNIGQTAASPAISDQLPKELAGAKPRYNYGSKGFGLDFQSDIEKALFITSQTNKSKADEGYRNFLRANGYSDKEIDTLGQQVREHIKGLAKTSEDERLTIGKLVDRNTPDAPPASVRSTVPTPERGALPENGFGPPEVDQNKVLEAIRAVAIPTGQREFARGAEQETLTADKAIDLLTKTPTQDIAKVVEGLRRAEVDGEQKTLLDAVMREATNRLEPMAAAKWNDYVATNDPQLFKEHEAIRALTDVIRPADTDMSSRLGSSLGSRVGSVNTGEFREVTPDTYLKAMGVSDRELATPQQIESAYQQYYTALDGKLKQIETKAEVQKLLTQVDEAKDSGDFAKASQLLGEVQAKRDALVADLNAKSGITETLTSATKVVNEYVISTVFTPSTLVVNTIPSLMKVLYRPALDFVVHNPFDSASFKSMLASYTVLGNSMSTAFQAAKLSFELEKSLLTMDSSRLLEQNAVIPGAVGRWLRIFPRLLNSTDEVFSQLSYRSFSVGQFTYDAYKAAEAKGLDKAATDAFVKDYVQRKTEGLFSKNVSTDAIDMMRQEGIKRGMEGDKLNEWVKIQVEKNENILREALHQEGVDYSKDLLFKREFSKADNASRLAAWYEELTNKNPWLRLAGQLFFRTPVRVFEEGFRLTAGVNLLSGLIGGQFLNDLRGANGLTKQVRATGEAMLSYAIAAWAMSQYAQGNLTGCGPDDYKTARTVADAKDWKPYTLRLGDKVLDYRNLDPFSTPLKIIADALDRYNNVIYRESQGEFRDGHEERQVLAFLSIASFSIGRAITDANLTDGLNSILTFGSDWMDPERKSGSMTAWMGKKLQLVVPNVARKAIGIEQPVLPANLTLEQYLRSAVNPADSRVPKQRTAWGAIRKADDPWNALTGIRLSSVDSSPLSEEEKFVSRRLADLAVAEKTNFIPPYKVDHPAFQGVDLRSRMMADGSATYYDRMADKMNEAGLLRQLHWTLQNGASDKVMVNVVNQVLKAYRDQALESIVSEEMLQQRRMNELIYRGTVLQGSYDSKQQPFRP